MKNQIKLVMISCLALLGLLTFMTTTFAQEKKTYIIATDTTYAPFEWTASDGQLKGIDIELLQAIAKKQNFDISIKSLGFNAALQALESEQVDGVIAGMGITEERKQKFDFSNPYYDTKVVMAVKPSDNYTHLKDLKDKKVAVKTGTQGASIANQLMEQYHFQIVTFDDSANMYEDVISGNSDAALEDFPVMSYAIKEKKLPLKVVGQEYNTSQFGFAVKKDKNQELLAQFNAGLIALKESGEYQEIIDKYTKIDDTSKQEENTTLLGIIQTNGAQLLQGLGQTLLLTLVSVIIALIVGVLLGLASVSENAGLKLLYTLYVDLMRGIPLLVLALFIYFAIPQFLNFRYSNPFIPSVITLSLNAAAYLAELFRGGILAVDKGQFEAAHSLGLPYGKTMQKIILPQAMKIMIPPFINQFVMTLKDTSLLSVIGLVELTQTGRLIIARTYASGNTWLIIALMYIVVITLLTKLSKVIEKKMN